MEYLWDHPLLVATLLATCLAALAWWGDRRRMRRRDLDKVGLMPWEALFFWALLAAVLLGAAAVQAWRSGG